MNNNNKKSSEIPENICCTEIVGSLSEGIARLSLHAHPFLELIYAVTADSDIVVGDICATMSSGDVALVCAGELHSNSFSGTGHFYSIKFSPALLFSLNPELPEYRFFNRFLSTDMPNKIFLRRELESTGFHAVIRDIMKEWDSKLPDYQLMIKADILRALTILSRCYRMRDPFISSSSGNAVIDTAIQYISSDFSRITEQDAADRCGLSLAYFSTLFKSVTGQKFGDYLLSVRISRAKKLLASTDKDITYIAYETGFSSSSHFIARFKELENITPGKYRRKIQSEGNPARIDSPQIITRFGFTADDAVRYLVLRYRTNRENSPTWMSLYIGSDKIFPGRDDFTWALLKGDEEWHTLVIDMEKTRRYQNRLLPRKDGKLCAGIIVFHLFWGVRSPSFYIDFTHIGYAKTTEEIEKFISDPSYSIGYYDERNSWVESTHSRTENKCETPPKLPFCYEGSELFSEAVSTGLSLRKIEYLTENKTGFTRLWCI